jgi:hypothetical protein
MAQKTAAPSAWTRQKEVITNSPATIVLEENAKKAKAEVALIADALADIDEGMSKETSIVLRRPSN